MTLKRTFSLLLACGAFFCAYRVASSHVAPSPEANNRYLKVVLLPGEARLSYTVFFGDRPGAAERKRMDKDGDGLLSDAEAQVFGDAVREAVAGHVAVELDGRPGAAVWRVTDVGLGLPQVAGGAFAVDLALHLPLSSAATHRLFVDDRWLIPDEGEHEVRIEESPGVRALAAHRGREGKGVQLRYAFRGAPSAPGERALSIEFTVDAAARAAASTAGHTTSPAPATNGRRWLWIALGLSGAGLAAGAAVLRRRGRGGSATTGTGTGTSR